MRMSKSKQRNRESGDASDQSPPAGTGAAAARESIEVREVTTAPRAVWRPFPGPRGAVAGLRVAFERTAYAELTAHARESLDAEVCGVLAGRLCEDDEGHFLHVEAAIRGTATAQGSTHVTFTQATWNVIHAVLERDYPKLRMVGWYHTHPGFGVEFSEMDRFIQKHFFPDPAQIALVTDPVNGAVALCRNAPQGIEYLERFWVDGREQQCQSPPKSPGGTSHRDGGAEAADSTRAALQALDARIGQLIQVVDEQRASFHRFLFVVGMVACLGIIAAAGYTIYRQVTARLEPPRLNAFVPVPVRVGDRTVMLGVGVVEWDVPDELNALLLELEQLKAEAAAERERQASPSNAAPDRAVTHSPTPLKRDVP